MPSNSLAQEAMDRVRRMYASFDSRGTRVPNIGSDNTRINGTQGNEARGGRGSPDPQSDRRTSFDSAQKPLRQKQGQQKPPTDKICEKPPSESDPPPKSLLDIFMKDRDQSLILLLLVLLMKDGADMNLTLALMYILI